LKKKILSCPFYKLWFDLRKTPPGAFGFRENYSASFQKDSAAAGRVRIQGKEKARVHNGKREPFQTTIFKR
jgi:hypothetical protein